MAKLNVPSSLTPGFIKLLKLSNDDLLTIAKLLLNFKVDAVVSDLTTLLQESGVDHIKEISPVIYSFGYLLIDNQDTSTIAKSLLNSFAEKDEANFNANDEDLVGKLKIILDNSAKIMLAHKAAMLYTSVKNIFRRSLIITDIRPIFHNDVNHDEKYALITQQLKLSYIEDGSEKNIFVNMDLKDLETLKAQIERAIEKEKNMVTQCASIFNFIDFNR